MRSCLAQENIHGAYFALSCKRSNCNKMENNKNIVKVARLRFDPKTANNGFPSSIMSLCMHPHYRLSLNYYELNQESLHCTKRDPPILFVSKTFCLRHVMGEILVRKLIHFDTDLFISIMFELGCTKFGIDQKAVVDPLRPMCGSRIRRRLHLLVGGVHSVTTNPRGSRRAVGVAGN